MADLVYRVRDRIYIGCPNCFYCHSVEIDEEPDHECPKCGRKDPGCYALPVKVVEKPA